MLYKVVLTFESVDEINSRVIIHIKATEQNSPGVMFILLNRAAESKDIVYLPGKIRVHGG